MQFFHAVDELHGWSLEFPGFLLRSEGIMVSEKFAKKSLWMPSFRELCAEKYKNADFFPDNGVSAEHHKQKCCTARPHDTYSALMTSSSQNEIVLYQPDNSLKLEVRLEDETVWLSQAQMAELFQTTRNNITMHISNIFKEGELEKKVVCKDFLHTTPHGAMKGHTQTAIIVAYNLDVIISVGYRVKSRRGTIFRQWANRVLKDYLLRGYAVNQRIERVEKFAMDTERRVTETEKKIDFFVRTALPPVQGVFYQGQIFDAYAFAADLIKSANKSLILLDNYVDESVLLLLSKRASGVKAGIVTRKISRQIQLDLAKHNAQYAPVALSQSSKFHDRFLLVDNTVYHIGASLKDLGKKLFAFSKMEAKPADILKGV